MKIKKYIKIWLRYTAGTSQIAFESRTGAAIFIIGKILRFVFFLLFIVVIFSKTKTVAGYSLWQMIFFFLTFNLVDTLPQFLLRDVYRFRGQIINGYFDHTLLKPVSPLFKSLFGGSDIFDFFIMIFLIVMLIIGVEHLGGVSSLNIFLYILLIINAFIIALSFHIFVLCLGILTTEVDNAIMLYRDLTQMGRFPVDIYREPLKSIITFVIPIGIMMTIPAKVMLGVFNIQIIIVSFGIGILIFMLSVLLWRYSLTKYSSASS
ncbi:MAG TPA: ABC-2 family transporter protein [Patescibacteria group bacterium]